MKKAILELAQIGQRNGTEIRQILTDKAYFLNRFCHAPTSIGSITPSSNFLAQAMLAPVEWDRISSIVELGAGTGVFTRYIQNLKDPECKGIIFEKDFKMRQRLEQQYPDLYLRANAEDVCKTVQDLGISQVDCILSGLPFANFPSHLRTSILENSYLALKPGGIFIAFQYSLQMRSQFNKKFSHIDLRFVPFNIPPAFVYYCYK